MGATFGLLSALWCYWHRKDSVFGGIGGGKLKCGSNFGASQWRTIISRKTMCKCSYKSPKQVPMDCWSGLEWLEEALLLSSCYINCDVNRVIVLCVLCCENLKMQLSGWDQPHGAGYLVLSGDLLRLFLLRCGHDSCPVILECHELCIECIFVGDC